ncbi:DUF302 domain-containing protein [uncultured Maribacter sp.]|uniref:DUF302 domain-containing protein n=1 Tax=uncultured Maribacter sp. TaxID=431308 RepID=UPI0030EF6571
MMESNEETTKETPHQNYMESRNTPYCFVKRYGSLTFDEALTQLRDSLKKADFDIIAEMDIEKYLNKHIKNLSSYKILLVCNKKTAADLLSYDVQMTTLIPCKISIKEIEGEALVEVSIEDTEKTWAISEKKEITDIAKNIKQTLSDILNQIGPKNVKL